MNSEYSRQALAKVGNPNVLINLISRRVRQLNSGGGAMSRPLISDTAGLGLGELFGAGEGLKRRIGILGGTFNPIHLGHLLIAQDALERANLERVLFIPSAAPPHKPLAGNVSAAHRLRMLKLALASDDRMAVDTLEIRRGGKSYSVDTLSELRRRQPRAALFVRRD